MAWEIFPIFQDEEWSFMVATHGEVREKTFNWAYGCKCGPKVEVNIYMKGISFGLLESDLQELCIVSAVYGDTISR